MKKNLIALIAATSILASCGAVFADEPAQPDTDFETIIQGDIMLISGDTPVSAPVSMPSYISKTVTVTNVTDKKISTTVNTDDAENPENTINFMVTDNTVVLGYAKGDVKSLKDVKAGDKITVFSNSYAPVPLILPPQYNADIIFIEDNSEPELPVFVDVDTYLAENETLVNAANTLELNIDENTEIVDVKGNKVEADKLANNDLAVVYTSSTKSIPAQTTPVKIIVLGENETALKQIEAAKNEPAVTPAPTETPEATNAPEDIEIDFGNVKSIKIGDKFIDNIYLYDTLMVPLREIAETLGFEVEWSNEIKSVMLNGGIYTLGIGVNSYGKGKMVPQKLSAHPEIINDLTYVPFDYFTEILEAKANVEIDEGGVSQIIELTL